MQLQLNRNHNSCTLLTALKQRTRLSDDIFRQKQSFRLGAPCLLPHLRLFSFFLFPALEKYWERERFGWDVAGYYLYLPATFIYHDLKGLEFRDSVFMPYGFTPDFQQASRHPETGNFVLKYSSGQAVMMLPGFIIGHTWAKLSQPVSGRWIFLSLSTFCGAVDAAVFIPGFVLSAQGVASFL